jgi:hypothetical protein
MGTDNLSEIQWPPSAFFRSYTSAMRGSTKIQILEDDELGLKFEPTLTGIHEAGHAVVSFILRQGCASISLSSHTTKLPCGKFGASFDGLFHCTKLRPPRADCLRYVIAQGIVTAAGPAAELAMRLHCDRPAIKNRRNSGDDASITKYSKCFVRPQAYLGLIWKSAQNAIADREIMTAILKVAERLNSYWPPCPNSEGKNTNTMAGGTARAIIRRCGIRQGMLDHLLPEPGMCADGLSVAA